MLSTIDTRWQDSFYAHVGTFLAKVRSVPSIIEARFGADRGSPRMRKWLDGFPPEDQLRRQTFSNQLRADREAFRQHHLTNERDVSRLGFPNIERKVVGPFGNMHTANPVNRIPTAEGYAFGETEDNLLLLVPARQRPAPVQPRWDQFTIGRKTLFDECRAYLALAQQLLEQARGIAQRVHGSDSLTTPPST